MRFGLLGLNRVRYSTVDMGTISGRGRICYSFCRIVLQELYKSLSLFHNSSNWVNQVTASLYFPLSFMQERQEKGLLVGKCSNFISLEKPVENA